MSVRNCHYSLRNSPKERSSHMLRGGSLKTRKVLSCSLLPDIEKIIASSEGPEVSPACSNNSSNKMKMGRRVPSGGIQSTWTETCRIATLSTTNFTCISSGLNVSCPGKRPSSNRLGLGTVLRTNINLLYLCKGSVYTAQRTVLCSSFILPPPMLLLKYTVVSFWVTIRPNALCTYKDRKRIFAA